MTPLVPRGLLPDALPDLPPERLAERFVGAVVDAKGREIPITEGMITAALEALDDRGINGSERPAR